MSKVTIKDLLENGVHFGHQTRRWNPKMARYIFCDRNGIYIINLEKSLLCLQEASKVITDLVSNGKDIMFVGTKKQAQVAIKETAGKLGMPYVVNRWLGGMLTNFETVKKSIDKMNQITEMQENGTYDRLTKKERLTLLKERDKINKYLEGIKDLNGLPGAIFVVDPNKEHIAVKEARKLNVPVIALIDTNCDPDVIDYPVPGNDDALRSVGLICRAVGDAIAEGLGLREKKASTKIKAEAPKTEEAAPVVAEAAKEAAPVVAEAAPAKTEADAS